MPDVAPKSPGFRSDEERSLARLARLERATSCLEGAKSIVIYKEIALFLWTNKATKGTIADRMRTRRERIVTPKQEEAQMGKEEKPKPQVGASKEPVPPKRKSTPEPKPEDPGWKPVPKPEGPGWRPVPPPKGPGWTPVPRPGEKK